MIHTDLSVIRPVFVDPGVPVKSSISMIRTNSYGIRLVLSVFKCISPQSF